jgi:phosphonate transport system substrate-binding protein
MTKGLFSKVSATLSRIQMKTTLCTLLAVMTAGTACTRKRAELGTAENPVKLFFVPSVDVKVIEDASKKVKEYLESVTPYKYEVAIPQSFVAVVEAFGTARADVSAMNTFGYILAHDKYKVEARMTVIRHGLPTYKAQIVVRNDSKISKLEDLNGKRFAFVDPSSTSGYLMPLKLMRDRGVKPSETMFAMRHDSVVSMVYQGQVDGGATFYSPPFEGAIQDARRLVKSQYPDVESKIKVLELTDSIPNDPVVFRRDMPDEMKSKITAAFMELSKNESAREAFKAMYGVTEFIPASDQSYDDVRGMLAALGKAATELVK